MANALATFVDDPAIALRAPEVPNASFVNGCNAGASNAPGIGIATENPNLEQSLPNWTLLDQHGNARTTQISQCIGGAGYSDAGTSSGESGTLPGNIVRIGTLPTQAAKDADPSLDGTMTYTANPSLVDLASGWVAAAP